jgi:hypothetical protein
MYLLFVKISLVGVDVRTVDGFQGSERDIIILSAVRTREGDVGFIDDYRRINVAMTRAKHYRWVFGHHAIKAAPDLSHYIHHHADGDRNIDGATGLGRSPESSPNIGPHSSNLISLLPPNLIHHRRGVLDSGDIFEGKIALGIYFSALWHPNSSTFTAALRSASVECKSKPSSLKFELVYSSLDSSSSSFRTAVSDMPWVAIDYEDDETRDRLFRRFIVSNEDNNNSLTPPALCIITSTNVAVAVITDHTQLCTLELFLGA